MSYSLTSLITGYCPSQKRAGSSSHLFHRCTAGFSPNHIGFTSVLTKEGFAALRGFIFLSLCLTHKNWMQPRGSKPWEGWREKCWHGKVCTALPPGHHTECEGEEGGCQSLRTSPIPADSSWVNNPFVNGEWAPSLPFGRAARDKHTDTFRSPTWDSEGRCGKT